MTTQPTMIPDAGVDSADLAALDRTMATLDAVRGAVRAVIFGQEAVIDHVLTGLLAGGHTLLVGVPGLAKTKLVYTLGIVLGLADKRVQFTPDLMPADILGAEILDEAPSGQRSFRFVPGPVFCQLLMADEINRASPRTQAALLQAMQERQVTVAGEPHPLPQPFHVLATQNPIEHEGTYPLPEAQLDRFLLSIDMGYPSREAERAMLEATTGAAEAEVKPVADAAGVMAAQALVRAMPMGESVLEAILDLVRAARPETAGHALVKEYVSWGPGPRAAQALSLAVRARSLLQGRPAPTMDDVAALAHPVLAHRMAVSFAAMADGMDVRRVVAALVDGLG